MNLLVFGAGTAFAQNYPTKPVRILTAEPGGGGDFVARVVAQGLTAGFGRQVIVDNRSGLSSIEAVAKAPPDGYTLLLHAAAIWLTPFMRDNVPWDPIKDFSPVTIPDASVNLVVVHPSVPVKSVKELIALAKARPGQLNYGSSTGGATHLAAELFKAMTNVDIVRISYRGNGPALNDLMGGQVQVMFPVVVAAMPHIKSGRLRGLAVTSALPSALAPDLPTVAVTVPGYESVSIHCVLTPAGTPPPIINRLNQEIVRFLVTPETKEKFLKAGLEVVGSSPEQLAAAMKSEMVRMGKVIKDAGIRDQ